MYRAVATDIDGTIADDRRRIDTGVIEAFRKLEDSGIPVILASGNVLPIMRALSLYIGTSGPVICENGGLVAWGGKQYLLSDKSLPERAIAHLERDGRTMKRSATDHWRVTEVALDMESTDPEWVRNELASWDGGVAVQNTGYAVHVNRAGVNKFTGLQKACELLRIDPSQVVAFGDSENDISILANCGAGVAVGNSTDQARSVASMVTAQQYGKGVLEGLAHFFGHVLKGEVR